MRTLCRIMIVIVAVALVAMACGTVVAAGKPRIVLAPVVDDSTPEAGKQRADGVSEAIRTAIKEAVFKSGNFVLVADTDIQKDLDQQVYSQFLSGNFDPATAAAIGQKVGAQALIKLHVLTNQMSTTTRDLILVKETEYKMQLAVSVEIVDIEKAVVSFMDNAQTDQKSKSSTFDIGAKGSEKPISLNNPKDVRVLAINAVTQDIAAKIISNAGRAKGKGTITSVKGAGKQGDSIVVDIGEDSGAAVDAEITIFGVDADGFEEAIGKCKIVSVQNNKSKANILDVSRSVVVGDMVSIATAAAGGPKPVSPGNGGGALAMRRVMVILPETHINMPIPDPAGETEIIKQLTNNGFIVVDDKITKEIKADDNKRALLRGDASKVLAMVGDKTDAEIIIFGEAFSVGVQRLSTEGGPAFKCGARIEIRAVQRDNGRILVADARQVPAAIDSVEQLAAKRALMSAAKLLMQGTENEPGFVTLLKERMNNPVQYIEAVVSGVESDEDLQVVEDGLKSASEGSVYRFAFRNSVAKFNVETTKSAQDLTRAISKLKLAGTLKLAGSTPSKVELTYEK